MSYFDRFSRAVNICPTCGLESQTDCQCWDDELDQRDGWKYIINHRRQYRRDEVKDAIAALRQSRREWS